MSVKSVLRLGLAGLLIVSGLSLGGLTLYGAFDPRPTNASQPALKPWATTTSPRAGAAEAKDAKKKRSAEKRPTDEAQKTKKQSQQAVADWWDWFNN
jgi:hypothetical protein